MARHVEMKPCCDMMKADLERVCDMHPDRADCPDALVYCDAETQRYGLYIHDGSSSNIRIKYCPWCGTKLSQER